MSIPSQSQSSPIIHFTTTVRRGSNPPNQIIVSPSSSIDYDSQQPFLGLVNRPQSTPISSPIFLPRLSANMFDDKKTNENSTILTKSNKKRHLTTFECSSLTNVTPLNQINNQMRFPVFLDTLLDDLNDDDENNNDNNTRYLPKPPPLLVLSQTIQAKHPEQLIDTELNNRFSSIKDLPNSPANYSFVFYGFTSMLIEEAKRLTRRMGDCFTSEIIDLTTTHIILPSDDPHMMIKMDLILGLICGCRIVTFEWLKSSSRIGEWLHSNRFEPKSLFKTNPALNLYRKFRQQNKSIQLFNECGLIYLTSIVEQRQLLLKLITMLGGNITLSRDRATVIVGQSSKILPIIIYPQVTEYWVIDSIKIGKCLPTDNYLIHNNNS